MYRVGRSFRLCADRHSQPKEDIYMYTSKYIYVYAIYAYTKYIAIYYIYIYYMHIRSIYFVRFVGASFFPFSFPAEFRFRHNIFFVETSEGGLGYTLQG